MNAVRSERVHQAYLFTGSRGIGKTSIARIFAKVLRCEKTRWEQASGPTPMEWLRSCDECPSCREITSSTSVDVIEIDGASNNGVEAVREIRENAKYLPGTGTRKIYIIDEVHMLTTAAFNALLKTLEEPPAHVCFVFATTEPHKIPATILSRCQRFDFRRTTVAQIQTRLTEITQAEKVTAEPGALALIARAAEGSMRDSLSLLDQVIAFSGNQVTAQSARESIGLIEGQTLCGILKGVFERKPLEALSYVQKAYEAGHDLKVLARSLLEFLHGVILLQASDAQSARRSGGMEFSEEEWAEIEALAKLRPIEDSELIFQVVHHGIEAIARSPQPRIVLDVLLIKCATGESLAYASGSGGGSAPTQAGAGSSAARATPAASTLRAEAAAPAAVAPAVAQTAAPSAQATVVPSGTNYPSTPVDSLGARRAPTAPAAQTAPATTSSAPQAAPQAPAAQVTPIAAKPAGAAGPATKPTFEGLIEHVRRTRPLLASILEHGACVSMPTTDSALVLGFGAEDSYYKEQLGSRIYQEQLQSISKDYFGKPVFLKIEAREADSESVAAKREREIREREEKARKSALNHPIIVEARSLFGGELGPIEVNPGEDHA